MAVAQSEKPNFYWLLSVWWAGSREAWQRVVLRLVGAALRLGRLVEEEEAAVVVKVSADSSGGILKVAGVVQVWVEGQGFWLAWHGLHVLHAIPSHPHTSPDRG